MRYIKYGFGILCFLIFGYLFYGLTLAPKDAPPLNLDFAEYNNGWELEGDDGSFAPISLPTEIDADRGEVVSIRTLLTDEAVSHRYMCLQGARQDIKIYVGDELRLSYSTENTRLTGKYTSPVFVMCPLYPEDSGKYLTFETVSFSKFSGVIHSVYVGEKLGLWYTLIRQQGVDQIAAFFTLMMGVLVVVSSIVIGLRSHRKLELMYLGWGIVFASIWIIANSNLRQIIFPALSVINDMTFLMLLLMPMTFCIYLNSIQKDRYKIMFMIVCISDLINSSVCIILHFLGIVDFSESFIAMALVALTAIVAMAVSMFIDLFRGYIREYMLVALGMLVVVITASGQIFIYLNKSDQFHTTLLELGLVFLLITSTLNTIRDILRINHDRDAALFAKQSESRFLANMSHEIRTPINAILGFNSLILRESREEGIREYAKDVESSGNTLLALINDILDLARVESGKMELMETEYDLFGMIDNVMRMMKIKADAKGLELKLELDENLPMKLKGDDVRIRQVLVNLINNAIKYTEKGSVTLRVKGERNENSESIHFSVKDTGSGIREEDMGKLFEKFSRIDEGKNRNIEGTGLGMSITVNLLSLLGSRLEVDSKYGEGSDFYFTLIQEIVNDAPIGDPEKIRFMRSGGGFTEKRFCAPGVRVFMCDDNQMNRKLFVALLRDTGMSITSAVNGTEAVNILKKEKFDIIFLDDMMPDLNGSEVLKEIRSDSSCINHGTPTVVLTANVIHGVRERYMEAGFDEYLSKPIKMDRMGKVLMNFLPEGSWHFEELKVAEDLPETPAQSIEAVHRPDISGINWDIALERTGSDAALDEMTKSFITLYDSDADELERFYEEGQNIGAEGDVREGYRSYRVKVHSMKSSAAVIGALQVSALAQILEKAADEGNIDYIEKINQIFIGEWNGLGMRLKEAYGEALMPALEQKSVDPEIFIQKLHVLSKAVEDTDLDTSDAIMGEIETFLVSEDLKVLVGKLKTAVLNLEDDECNGIIEKMIETLKIQGGM